MKSVRTFFATALLVAIFLSLANWQWNRASDMKKPIKFDNQIYKLEEIANAGQAVEDSSIHKLVKVNGKYLLTRTAQFTNPGKIWDVSLMAIDSGGAVLVVRGITGTNNREVDEATDRPDASGPQATRPRVVHLRATQERSLAQHGVGQHRDQRTGPHRRATHDHQDSRHPSLRCALRLGRHAEAWRTHGRRVFEIT